VVSFIWRGYSIINESDPKWGVSTIWFFDMANVHAVPGSGRKGLRGSLRKFGLVLELSVYRKVVTAVCNLP
jgi:hypothetical protein